jgi:hypothetical protein
MKRRYVLVCFVCALCMLLEIALAGIKPPTIWAYQGDVAYYEQEGKIGLMGPKKAKITEPIFDAVTPFYYDNVAAVDQDGKLGLINKKGEWIFESTSTRAIEFYNGYAVVKHEGNKWSLINTKGETIVEPKWYVWAAPYACGFFAVDYGNEKGVGFVGLNGEPAFDGMTWQHEIGYFSENLAAVWDGKEWGYINTEGEMQIPYQFGSAHAFSSGLAAVRMPESAQWIFIDTNGEQRLSGNWDRADRFGEFDLAPVEMKEKWGFINTKGKLIIKANWDTASPFSSGLACVSRNDKYGFINKSGKIVLKLSWSYAASFVEGYAYVMHKDGWDGFINTKGKIVCRSIGGK